MAQRPVFVPLKKAPYVDTYLPEFVWNSGLSVSQKQKNIVALHESFRRRFPDRNLLEISSKSLQPFGVSMSAFNLKKEVPSLGTSVPVECIYQGSKVFSAGGPYTELYTQTSNAAKKDPRLKSSGMLRRFQYEGRQYPIIPMTVFYDWLYINAILENPGYADQLIRYDAFTDIEFNPEKSTNCQAKAAALFVSLHRLCLLDQCRDFDSFIRLFTGK